MPGARLFATSVSYAREVAAAREVVASVRLQAGQKAPEVLTS